MARAKHQKLLTNRLLFAMLVGSVLVPAVLSLSVGIVALALWQESFGLVFGVLTLVFAATAIAGGAVAFIFVRRRERLITMQSDFVANVSHELRTPLSGIRLVTESLEAGLGDDATRRAALVEMLGDEMRHLEDLVERVLMWRRIEEGPPQVARELVPIAALLGEAIDTTRHLPEAKAAEIRCAVAPGTPPVEGDRMLLVHALTNLLHNSVKFAGQAGPIDVAARRERATVVVTVSDRGQGIARGEQKRIFERFYRSPRHRVGHAGVGLGLAIVANVVATHRGRVSVASSPGAGAVFTVVLPAARGHERG